MFLPIISNSVNDPSMLSEVNIIGSSSHYRSKDGSANVLLCEYYGTLSNQMISCDLVIYEKSGDIYMHDFMLLNDGSWRSAYGAVSANLADLIPEVVLAAILLKREYFDEFSIEGNHV